ncbi:hypothetical protein GLW05_20875 [Pontibacillus yanchengensis]|uniref:Uncharacterized protein n=1 Tax=Pontibacillus yanchengensis TaxID=462910 RepID=A0A6I5A726_9BACI|nr:hypothetical protein [Pontibacillus yanchengensis]MYL36028.1 hypothetical protein [Pontibacillus yanchengensis]
MGNSNNSKKSKEEIEEFFNDYVEENEIKLEDEEGLKEYVIGKYNTFNPIKINLDRIKDKEREGYDHLSDLDIFLIGNQYFKREVWNYYDEVEYQKRMNHVSNEGMAELFNVGKSTYHAWLHHDDELKTRNQRGVRFTTHSIVNVLVAQCLEGNVNAIKFALPNLDPENWQHSSSLNMQSTVTKKTNADEKLEDMSEEELVDLFTQITSKLEE